MYFVYIIKSLVNEKVYVGYTGKTVEERLKEHNSGSNKWTKSSKPFKIVYYEKFICEEDAKLREEFLKSGVGRKIKNLIVNNFGV
ncbi:MAG TPA: GIY-YIG nuclease family protein [Patescibacteria group bacterium]|nr:GIY-YIG nuclease family protein [Patescibacteria group bacterium]